jgi:aerobactin synthase
MPGGGRVEARVWAQANRAIVARAIGEFTYEEAFAPQPLDPDRTLWELRLSESVAYRFAGTARIWGNLSVKPDSILRVNGEGAAPADDAVQFMIDAREVLGVAPDTLCTYAKELANTLLADARLMADGVGGDAAELAGQTDAEVQRRLFGHPKAPANKGRLGWGLADAEAFGPEFGATTQLFWLAASRATCRIALAPDLDEASLLADAIAASERASLEAACEAAGISAATHALLPVHPWQWDNVVAAQFAGEIAAGRLVPLGSFGDPFRPQQSLRTLANAARPEALHVKLPLTVLNTSAWRGVPGKYMAIGAALSDWLSARIARDAALAPAILLREVAGMFYPHPHYEQVADAPYKFHELLGAIWRESPEARIGPGRKALMMGALSHRDGAGRPLVSALIARSGLSRTAWLGRLFATVVVPLYHFLCRYGVGFLAHGQNVTIVLEGAVPVGVVLKDLQGDLDLVAADFPELATLPPEVARILSRKPPKHLIHHLQTGHFASVLRFVSDVLAEEGLPEPRFYGILADTLRAYQARHPELAERFALFDLFEPTMPRICINRVRLAIGYGDAANRPVPGLGTPLPNPLHRAGTMADPIAEGPTP